MYGALLRNAKGGVLISDETPVYMEAIPTGGSVTSSVISSEGQITLSGRGVDGRKHFSPWTSSSYAITVTTSLPSNSLPVLAIKGSVLSSFGGPRVSMPFPVYGVAKVRDPSTGAVITTNTNGIALDVVSRAPELDNPALDLFGWKFVLLASSVPWGLAVTSFRYFVTPQEAHINLSEGVGLEVYTATGSLTYSSRMDRFFTGGLLNITAYAQANPGSVITSTSFTNPRIPTHDTGVPFSIEDAYILSAGGYGVIVSDAFAVWHGWQTGWNGWDQVTYASASSFFKFGFCVVNGNIHMAPIIMSLSNIPGRSRSDSGVSIGGVLAIVAAAYTGGASLAFLATAVAVSSGALINYSSSYDVKAPNTTYDGHLNTVIRVAERV